jgi:hypothetical protein
MQSGAAVALDVYAEVDYGLELFRLANVTLLID